MSSISIKQLHPKKQPTWKPNQDRFTRPCSCRRYLLISLPRTVHSLPSVIFLRLLVFSEFLPSSGPGLATTAYNSLMGALIALMLCSPCNTNNHILHTSLAFMNDTVYFGKRDKRQKIGLLLSKTVWPFNAIGNGAPSSSRQIILIFQLGWGTETRRRVG